MFSGSAQGGEWRALQKISLEEILSKGSNLLELKKYKEAAECYNLYMQYNTDRWFTRELLEQVVTAYAKGGKRAIAINMLASFIKGNPSSYDLLLLKSQFLREEGKPLEALNVAVKHISKDYQSRHGHAADSQYG